MSRLPFLAVAAALLMSTILARADASGAMLASYYDRHAALVGGVAWGWVGAGAPVRLTDGVRQVGVGRDAWFVLRDDGRLLLVERPGATPTLLMQGVRRFAAGETGWFAIDAGGVLWRGHAGAPVQRVADGVAAASIGDGADYYVGTDGRLWVKGLAHRGQYGDGRLQASETYVTTASEVLDVKAHTGHAIALRRDGTVIGTGGNRYGPLSSHGLGDKADRWGPIFDGAAAIATGSRHSAAIRADGRLWVWGEGFGTEPRSLMERITAVAAGDRATIALDAEGRLWQWDGGRGPRQVHLR